MRPEEIAEGMVLAARALDMKFGISKLRGIGYDNGAVSAMQAKLEGYSKELEEMGKVRMREEMEKELKEAEKAYEGALADVNTGTEQGFAKTFREKGFEVKGMEYTRKVIRDSTLIGGDEYRTQRIDAYYWWSGCDISYKFVTEEEAKGITGYEMQLFVQVAMNSITKQYNEKQVQLEGYIGDSPEFDDKGEKSRAGTGESERLITALVDAEKEKAEGEAKKDAPFYSKGLIPGLNFSLSSIAKIGLMFVPGGQLITLGLTVGDTAAKYASGELKGAGGLLNMATAAVGAVAGWAGDALKGAIGAAKAGLSIVGNVVKNVVKGVGEVINKGFRVGAKGNMDWSINEVRKNETAIWQGMASEMGGDLIGDSMDELGLDTEILRNKYTLSDMAKSFTSEAINFGYTKNFNVGIGSIGTLMADYMDQSFGDPKKGNQTLFQRFGENLYNQDQDIANFKSFGLGLNFSKDGAKFVNHVSGGFDLSSLTIAGLGAVGNLLKTRPKDYTDIDRSPFTKEGKPLDPFKDKPNQEMAITENERKKEEDEEDTDYTKWDKSKLDKAAKEIFDKQAKGEKISEADKSKLKAFYAKNAQALQDYTQSVMKDSVDNLNLIRQDHWELLMSPEQKQEYIKQMKEQHKERNIRIEMVEKTAKDVYDKYKNTLLKGVDEKEFVKGFRSLTNTETGMEQWHVKDKRIGTTVVNKAGELVLGDKGKAVGMTQVWPSVHTGYDADRLADDVLYNIKAGAEIFANSITRAKAEIDNMGEKVKIPVKTGILFNTKLTFKQQEIDLNQSGYAYYNGGEYFTLKNVGSVVTNSEYCRKITDKNKNIFYQMKSVFRPYVSTNYLGSRDYYENDNRYRKNLNGK